MRAQNLNGRTNVLAFILVLVLFAGMMTGVAPERAVAEGGGHNDTLAIKDTIPELPNGGEPAPGLNAVEFIWLLLSTL